VQDKLKFACHACQSTGHGTAMCPQYDHTPSEKKNAVNSNSVFSTLIPTIMSIINIEVSRAGKTVVVPFLIDTGAQCSYIASEN
jgi:hypothetical protein